MNNILKENHWQSLEYKTKPTVHRTSCHPSAGIFTFSPLTRPQIIKFMKFYWCLHANFDRSRVTGYTWDEIHGNYVCISGDGRPQTWDCSKTRRVRRCLCTKFNGILSLSGTGAVYPHDTIQLNSRLGSAHTQLKI